MSELVLDPSVFLISRESSSPILYCRNVLVLLVIIMHKVQSDDDCLLLRQCLSLTRGNECRYNLHSTGPLGWPFPMLKYKYIFQIKYAILSNSTRGLLWLEITKTLTAVLKTNFLRHFIIIFDTLLFPGDKNYTRRRCIATAVSNFG